MSEKKTFTLRELAEKFNVSKSTVRSILKKNNVESIGTVNDNMKLYDQTALAALQDSMPSNTSADANSNKHSISKAVSSNTFEHASMSSSHRHLNKHAIAGLIVGGVSGLVLGGLLTFGIMDHTELNSTALKTNYGRVTNAQIYQRVKGNSSAQSAAQTLALEKVLEHDFGDAASSEKVNAQFKKLKANQLAYAQTLQQLGSDDAIKANIKDGLLMQAAVKANVHISDKMLRKEYKNYRPTMQLAYVEVKSKAKAQELQAQLSSSGSFKEFKKTAQTAAKADPSNVTAGLLPAFDSLADSSTVPTNVKNQAMKMKTGETSDVIKTGKGLYSVLYMKSIANKGSFSQEKGKLKNLLVEQKISDSNYSGKILAKYAKKAHVKAADSVYKDSMKSLTALNKN